MQLLSSLSERGPRYKNSETIYLNYIFNKSTDMALQFNKNLESELKIQKEHLEDRNRKLETES